MCKECYFFQTITILSSCCILNNILLYISIFYEICYLILGEINPPGPSDNDEESDDENVSNLYQEARLPLQVNIYDEFSIGPITNCEQEAPIVRSS